MNGWVSQKLAQYSSPFLIVNLELGTCVENITAEVGLCKCQASSENNTFHIMLL